MAAPGLSIYFTYNLPKIPHFYCVPIYTGYKERDATEEKFAS